MSVYVVPTPCIEIVQLPSDWYLAYSTKCQMMSHISRLPSVGYMHSDNTISITFSTQGHLQLDEDRTDLQVLLPMIIPEFLYSVLYLSNLLSPPQPNKEHRVLSPCIVTRIKNTYLG